MHVTSSSSFFGGEGGICLTEYLFVSASVSGIYLSVRIMSNRVSGICLCRPMSDRDSGICLCLPVSGCDSGICLKVSLHV